MTTRCRCRSVPCPPPSARSRDACHQCLRSARPRATRGWLFTRVQGMNSARAGHVAMRGRWTNASLAPARCGHTRKAPGISHNEPRDLPGQMSARAPPAGARPWPQGRSMRSLALLAQLVVASATAPSRLLFNFTEARYPWTDALQISELRLYSASGRRIATVDASSTGTPAYRGQFPFAVEDGSVHTKWVDVGFKNESYSLLYLTPLDVRSTVAYCALSGPSAGPCKRPSAGAHGTSCEQLSHWDVHLLRRAHAVPHLDTTDASCVAAVHVVFSRCCCSRSQMRSSPPMTMCGGIRWSGTCGG